MASGSDLKFVSDYEICPENSDLADLLEQMDQCSSDSVYKDLTDTIMTKYVDACTGEQAYYVRNVLIEFFARTHARKNLRKYIYEKLNSLTVENKTLFEHIVDSVTTEIQANINNLNIFRIAQCFRMLCFLAAYIQNFPDNTRHIYLLEKVFPFYLCIMEVYTSQLFNNSFCRDGCEGKSILYYDDCYTVLCMTLRQLAIALPRAQYEGLRSYAVKMVILTHEILQFHSQLRFETISKCTIVLAYFSVFIPEDETEFLKYKEHPILEFMDNPSNDYCMVLKSKTLTNVFVTDSMKVVLNLAVYTSINQNKLLEIQVEQKPLLECVYLNLIHLGIQMTSFPDQISPISRTLDAMSKYLSSLENYDEIFDQALKFAWGHLDHFVEHVVISTRSFLRTVVKEAVDRFHKDEKQHLEKFFKDLNSMSVFSKVRLNALVSVSRVVHCDLILANCPQIQNQLLTLATSSAEHDMAGQAYIQMMTTHLHELPEEETIKTWLRPVLNILRQPNIKYHSVLEEIVSGAFKSRPTIFRVLFNPKTAGTGTECVIILKCAHYARMNGITLPMEPDANPREYWRNLIVKTKLELCMIHQDEEVRINALRVIAECQKSTEEFTIWELQYLIRYFQNNVATQTPSVRNKIVSYYKKIITRFHVTYANLLKKITNLEALLKEEETSSSPEDETEKTKAEREENEQVLAACRPVFQEYKNFFMHLVQLLVFYLSPDANYSRRSICLELLIFVHPFSEPTEWKNMFQQDEVKNLKRLLSDGYESNKAMAVALLSTLPSASLGLGSEKATRDYFEKCLKMACDVRPSQSISASYMFQVVLQSEFPFRTYEEDAISITNKKQCLMLLAMRWKLENMYKACNEDVVEAAKSPFYGLLFSCRNLLRNRDIRDDNEVYAFIFEDLAMLCLKIQEHIMPVVCNTSPEGYLPENSEDSDDSFLECDQSSKAQRILVYAWKTMKEIMLLLAELANQTVTLENVLEMLSEEYLLKIGNFFMDIFVTTKHRGVFEQAHVAFTTICRSFIHSKNENLNNLPVKWLNEAVALCTGKKLDERLCATRRSAGLPFLILSIIPTLSETNRDYLRRTVDPLLNAAIGPNDELRMHSLNVLRFTFKNSKLSDNMTNFIDKAAIAALVSFKSKTWGVRNSATLLLSTLIVRMFGVPNQCGEENRMTLAVFYMRFKNLFDFLLGVLEEESGKSDSLMLHPVLLILSRLYPSHNDNINEKVKKHIPYINVCMRNASYRTRDLAARASVSLISEHCLMGQLNENFNRIGTRMVGDTECHGLLLQIGHIFHTTIFEELAISDYLMKSRYLLTQAGKRHSHLTVTLYMDIVFMLLTKYRNYKNLDLLKDMVVLLARQSEEEELSTCQTSYVWSRFQLLLFILVNKFQHVAATYRIITRIIIKSLYGQDIEMKKKCLHLLIYLNQHFSDDPYKEHPLITAGDVEICPQIRALVHSFDFKTKKEILTFTHPYLISFFYAELKAQLKNDNNYFILIFLLLRFYPCFFTSLRTDRKQNILDWFLSMTKVYNEEIVAGIISCLKSFIISLEHEELKHLRYSDLIRLLMESAAPSAADYRRLTVAQFLVGTQVLFKCKIFNEYDRYNVLNIVMVLLEDDEAVVRNTMSTFPTKRNRVSTTPALWHVIPHKARTTLLVSSATDFKNDVAICCLTSWALRRLPEVTRDASEVYERGEMNIYAENIPVTQSAAKVLHTLLWNLGDVLSYEDRTIFLEEQTLLITTVVLNSLIKIPSPMMDRQTKRTVICVFKCISKFIEECTIGNDFHNNFKRFFNSRILKFLRNSLDTDYSSAKAFLTYLYNPLLNAHFRFSTQ